MSGLRHPGAAASEPGKKGLADAARSRRAATLAAALAVAVSLAAPGAAVAYDYFKPCRSPPRGARRRAP